MDPEIEAKARAIERAARERKPLPRGVWIAAAIVSVACVAGLAIAWIEDRAAVVVLFFVVLLLVLGLGFWLGLLVGLGLGIAIGSVLAVRRNR